MLKEGAAMEELNDEIPVLYMEKKDCCGCGACFAICPVKAISMVDDDEGFDYPVIDPGTCSKCYQCIKICPLKAK